MFYIIPDSLPAEITELESKIQQFQDGRLDASAFKVARVPFGVYEQRKDNTYMIRIRCPGGALTPLQLRTIAELSRAHAADTLHITTRQEIQIHDVALETVVPLMRQLLKAGLATRGGGGNTVRNITASFDAGVSKDEAFDVSPYAFALTSRLIAEPDSWLLPRKYKISFANSSKDNVRAAFNDLGFIAKLQNGVRGFEVYVAGGMGGKPQVGQLLHDFAPDTEVYFIAEAIKRLFHRHGNRKNRHAARLRFLWNSLGEAKFRELYQAELEAVRQENPVPLSLPSVNQGSKKASVQPTPQSSPAFQTWRERYVSEQKQPGLFSVLLPIFLGNLANDGALALADFLLPFGEDVLRATLDQNFCLRNIPEQYLGNVFALAQTITPLSAQPRFLSSAVACTGASTCKLGICMPRGALSAIVKRLQKDHLELDPLADLRLNLSGCPNSCGAHLTADLGFFGKVARQGQSMYPSYGIVVGAQVGRDKVRFAEPAGEVSARELPAFVSDFLGHYLQNKTSFGTYSDYLDQAGKTFIHQWTDAHKTIPDFEEDKNYYYDWEATEIFSLAGRGLGECSAGLFDLIEADVKRLKELQSALAQRQAGPDVYYQMTLSAARMLLITRAVEPRSDEEVFEQFRRHFLQTSLINPVFERVLEAAQRHDDAEVSNRSGEVLSLVCDVQELYGKMDNSLHFPGEAAIAAANSPATSPPAPAPILTRNLRGVACPMNFVKTKLALEGLKPGQRLQILLDDGAPIENVPRSVSAEGHKILTQAKEGDGWSVIIEKQG